MKKKYLITALSLSVLFVSAQTENPEIEKKNEIKTNTISLLLGGAIEGTYERILNRKSAVGASAFCVFSDRSEDDLNYSFSPFYRRYFGKKTASGFFAEGFGMLSSIDGKKIYDPTDHSKFTEGSDVIDFSVGAGIGSKWVTKSGFMFEVNAGWGKLLFNTDKTDHTQVVRYGIHLGYRF